MRAVRDERWKYIRNYRPGDAGARPSDFRDHLDVMAELWELDRAGQLEGPAALWFASPRPKEELYFLPEDPDEVRNRAGDPEHAATLVRMRGELDAWLDAVPDQGAIPEPELVEDFWPGGVQPATSAPSVRVAPTAAGEWRVALDSATPGASIGFRRNGRGAVSEWDLYRGPFVAVLGDAIEAKAIRYGYGESDVVRFSVPGETP